MNSQSGSIDRLLHALACWTYTDFAAREFYLYKMSIID